ncbi:YlxR family protein [Frankia sp. Mgl5]|uniref:YlxR family protein n=1 Tax=Frankia sp. Mgl5 TaxID=2933793 RepID=UPI00200E1F1C|nr:YlxR family protein [Frankia sp. Mgl5]MCK9927126.1 YlxR family protein [Frankia sp. Mgl5]
MQSRVVLPGRFAESSRPAELSRPADPSPRVTPDRAPRSNAERGSLQDSGPIRTCVGCRTRAARSSLLRIVVIGGELLPDVRRRMPGRGAHVHPDLACVDLAERRKAFPRALRVAGPLGLKQVRAHLEQRTRNVCM